MSETSTVPKSSLHFGELNQYVKSEMARLQVPGVAVGIWHGGQEFVAGYGVTSLENPLPVTVDTLFQIGSVSKTFTATAFMRLVEMGKLDLDKPIREYLPDFQLSNETTAANVTARHIFTHTSGWVGDYFADFGNGDAALAQYVTSMVDLPVLYPTGEIWSYNNAGFSLAGRLIEIATGQTYEAAMQELVFAPLGIKQAFFFPSDVMTHRFVVGHFLKEQGPEVLRTWALPRAAHAAGAIATNVKEMLRYARFQMGDGTTENGTRLLSPETMTLMQSILNPAGNAHDGVGISWFVRYVGGLKTVGHGGATSGQMTNFSMIPEKQFAIIIVTNSNRGSELHGNVTSWAFKQYLGATNPALSHRELSRDELAAYAGRYNAALSDVELILGENGLMLQSIPKGGFPNKDVPPAPAPPPVRVAFFDTDKLVALDAPFKDGRGEFLHNPDGTIAWFRFGGRIHARQPKKD